MTKFNPGLFLYSTPGQTTWHLFMKWPLNYVQTFFLLWVFHLIQIFSSRESLTFRSTFCNLSASSLLGANGVFPWMTIFNPGQSLYSTPAQVAWHLLAKSLSPSREQTGKKIWLHFLISHLSQDPLLGKFSFASVEQMASQRLGNVFSPPQNGR